MVPRLGIGVVKLLNLHHDDRQERAVAVDETNKSSSNTDKMEKEEQPLIVSAIGQENHDDDHPVETQFRSTIKKPPAQISPPLLSPYGSIMD